MRFYGRQEEIKAQLEAKMKLEKAQQDIETEVHHAKKQIQEEITEVAFMAAQKILEKEIDEETQKNYVEAFIKEDK